MINGDPHLHFAHGGRADFRGSNGTYFALLSAPGVHFSAMTVDTVFLLPRPQLVHGSFFTAVAWTVRGTSGRVYGVESSAGAVGFRVVDPKQQNSVLVSRSGVWQQWAADGVRAVYKQATVYVRTNGWEANATRKPVYNYVSGPSQWRFDITIRPLGGTGLEAEAGSPSKTCFPHGLVGQSWDGDSVAVDGATDDYAYDSAHPVITTTAMAEGAIEGTALQYGSEEAHGTDFAYSRFDKQATSFCRARDTVALQGRKRPVRQRPLQQTGGSSD